MKYILYIEDHTGTAELEFDSLKDARAELTTRLSFAYSNGSSFDKKNQDDYTVSNYWEGPTHLYIKRIKETTKNKSREQSLHIAIYIGKFKINRVFKTCEALHNYVQSILTKGYTAFGTEYNGKTEKWKQFKTSDWNTMCSEIFEYGLILRKTTTNGKLSEIKIYEHKPQPKKKTK